VKALVAISVSREWIETEFLQMLPSIIVPNGWKITYGWLRQFTAAERHNIATEEAKYYDKVLFLDTDQIYPPDYYVKMLEHDEPLVSALNTTRYYPYDLCAFSVREEEKRTGENGEEVVIPLIEAMGNGHIMGVDSECFKCDITGTGALMIDPDILGKISKPYFKDIYSYDGKRLLCDDFYFGYKLFKAGYKPLIDTRIIPGHIAKVVVKPYNALDLKKAWEKVNSGWGITKDGKKA
jgi:hypothetical protein